MKRVYRLCTGQNLEILADKENSVEVKDICVRLEYQDSVLLSEFVYNAAIRWKRGEISVFIELLELLYKEITNSATILQEDKINEEASDPGSIEDREIEDPVEQEDDNEDDEDGDYHDEDQKDESISPSKSRLERSERSSLKTRKKRNNKLIIEEVWECEETEHIKIEPSIIKSEDYLNDVEEGKRLQCPDCDVTFDHDFDLKSHFVETHLKPGHIRCHLCGLSLKTSYNLKIHIDTIHNKRKYFKCEECDFETSKRGQIRQHIIEKHGVQKEKVDEGYRETERTCEICENVFVKQSEYRTHIQTEHHDAKRYKCKLCSQESDSHLAIKDHINELHGQDTGDEYIESRSDEIINLKKFKKPLDRVSCDQCSQTFCSKNSLNTHIRSVHDKVKDFQCLICSSEFTTVSGVKKHIKLHHDVVASKGDYSNRTKERKEAPSDSRCSHCTTDFGSSDQLVDHVISAHPAQPDLFPQLVQTHGPLPWSRSEAWERENWTCPVCPQHMVFRTESVNGMVSHVKLSHPTSIICWVCGQSWSDKQGKMVYEHMKECHPLKSLFACDKCGVYNQSKKFLNNHRKIHRMEELDGPMLSCEQCDYVTPRPDMLSKHRFSHRASKTFMCDDCGKVLKSRTALATHSKLHTDDKRNQCTVCYKVFSQRGYLMTHMNSHSDSKPYSCEFCAMTFFGPTNLSQHRKRTHGDMIGESPKLSCDLCPKKFWIPSELKYHRERVHEGKKDFSCTECQKRFADKKNLKKHLTNVHKLKLHEYNPAFQL